MRRFLIAVSIVALGLGALGSAHSSHRTDLRTITVTGLVERTNYSHYSSETPFLLTHAQMAATNTVSGTSPCVTSIYRLEGHAWEFARHVGDRVRVTGSAPASWPRVDRAYASTDAPELQVSSVEWVSD